MRNQSLASLEALSPVLAGIPDSHACAGGGDFEFRISPAMVLS